ncbi:MAG: hypothetical protein Q8O30_05560 [Candidatus Omnitrophota bacterium]|nr:hypothetical protein [Candidatus Omnitrophota bacterium]
MALLNLFKKVFKAKVAKKKKSIRKLRKKNPTKKPLKKIIKKPKPKKVKKLTKPLRKSAELPKEKKLGVITHYFGKISVGIIKLSSPLKVGEKIHIKGAHDEFTQIVSSMQYNHKDITDAKKGFEIGVKVSQRVHENDKVYRAAE